MDNGSRRRRDGRTFSRAKTTAAAAAARATCCSPPPRTVTYLLIVFASAAAAGICSVRPAYAAPQTTDVNVDRIFTHAGRSCKCVPFYQCAASEVVDVPSGTPGITNPCASTDYQCCSVNAAEPNISPSSDNNAVTCGFGSNNGMITPKISADASETLYGEYPWMAVIYEQRQSSEIMYLCGGSLIHPQVVLTAAHCVHGKNANKLVVHAGDWDLENDNEPDPAQKAQVSQIIIHENYFGGGRFYNDVALLFITPAYLINENVGILCLPPQDFQFQTGKCYASGWGKNKNDAGDGLNQSVLKRIDLPIVARDICLMRLKLAGSGKNFKLHDSFLCAGGQIGKDTCEGDGGSPLICSTPNDPKQYYQAGIVSWGIDCGTTTPGVYADVSKFRRWIDQQMINANLDTSFYDYNT